jgi:glycerophosphoryl diester phosphodiesterase
VIAHRGAPRLAPENTIAAFRAAVALGVDAIEFDVIALPEGPLVVAHSDRLEEITHGAAHGTIGRLSLAALRELAPHLPTLEETLAWFTDEGRDVALHLDLKLGSRLDEVVSALGRFGLAERAVASSSQARVLRQLGAGSPAVRTGLTYPADLLGISRRRALWPFVRFGLALMRATVPTRLGGLLGRAGATALMLNHTLVTPRAVAAAHALGVPVLTWTVDEAEEVRRVAAAGVDAVISNDPEMLLATLGR